MTHVAKFTDMCLDLGYCRVFASTGTATTLVVSEMRGIISPLVFKSRETLHRSRPRLASLGQ